MRLRLQIFPVWATAIDFDFVFQIKVVIFPLQEANGDAILWFSQARSNTDTPLSPPCCLLTAETVVKWVVQKLWPRECLASFYSRELVQVFKLQNNQKTDWRKKSLVSEGSLWWDKIVRCEWLICMIDICVYIYLIKDIFKSTNLIKYPKFYRYHSLF